VSYLVAGAARTAAAAMGAGWWHRALAGVAGAPQVRYGPVERCVDMPGPEPRGAHQGQ
jgi:hypothetical protein